jgi:hypothetical protein
MSIPLIPNLYPTKLALQICQRRDLLVYIHKGPSARKTSARFNKFGKKFIETDKKNLTAPATHQNTR